jgi:hypothetical protein
LQPNARRQRLFNQPNPNRNSTTRQGSANGAESSYVTAAGDGVGVEQTGKALLCALGGVVMVVTSSSHLEFTRLRKVVVLSRPFRTLPLSENSPILFWCVLVAAAANFPLLHIAVQLQAHHSGL